MTEIQEEQPLVHIIQTDDTEETNSNTDITVSEYLTDNYGSTITVSEYLANNYPPKISSRSSTPPPYEEQNKLYGPISMVPRRASSTSSENMTVTMSDTNMTDEQQKYQVLDDEELKKARRRMKNKISAQESRRRKKEYVDALELKMKQRDQEKRLLTEKVTELEDKVRQLVDQLFQVKQNQHHELPKNHTENFPPKSQKESVSVGTQTGICLECYLQMPMKSSKTSANTNKSDNDDKRLASPTEQYPSKYRSNEKELDSDCINHEKDRPDDYFVYNTNKPDRYHPFRDEHSRFSRYDNEEYIMRDEGLHHRRQFSTSPHLSAFSVKSPIHRSKSSSVFETYTMMSEKKTEDVSLKSYDPTSPRPYYKHQSLSSSSSPDKSSYKKYLSTLNHQ